LSFTKSNCRDFIANYFISPQFTRLSHLTAMLKSHHKLQQPKQFSSLKMHFADLVYLTAERHWKRCERRRKRYAGLFVGQQSFWTNNVIIL